MPVASVLCKPFPSANPTSPMPGIGFVNVKIPAPTNGVISFVLIRVRDMVDTVLIRNVIIGFLF